MKEQVKELWKLCFTDSEEFVELYFSMRYKERENQAILEGEKVVSALQMIPYPMTFCGEIIDTSYISGACTHPNQQGHGLMKNLLSSSFEKMYQKKTAFSTLIPAEPWLFDYYSRMGYASVFYYLEHLINLSSFGNPPSYKLHSHIDCKKEIYTYFQSEMQKRPCCIQHTEEDFKVILADMALSGGKLYELTHEGTTVGIAITHKEENQLIVKELLSNSSRESQLLLNAIGEEEKCNDIKQIQPPTEKSSVLKLGMARIIDAKQVLSIWAAAYPEKRLCIFLHDDILQSNCGYYLISQGICTYFTSLEQEDCVSMTIAELTEYILSPLHPYMSLMLN